MLEKLNSPGGHVLIYFCLIWTGIAMYWMNLPKSDDVYFGAFTALLAVLAPKTIAAVTNGVRSTSTLVEETTSVKPAPPQEIQNPKPE